MRVALVSGSTVYHLAGQAGVDERTHSSAADFSMNPEALQPVTNLLNAETATPRDRGNLLIRGSFSTTRLFGTGAEAWAFSLDYDSSFPRTGTLRLDLPITGGGVWRREVTNAVVSPPGRKVIGRTVMLSYNFMGSEVVTVSGYPSAIVVSGTSAPAGANGTYAFTGIQNGRPVYTKGSYFFAWSANRWNHSNGLADYWYSTADVSSPSSVTSWTRNAGSGASGTLSVVAA